MKQKLLLLPFSFSLGCHLSCFSHYLSICQEKEEFNKGWHYVKQFLAEAARKTLAVKNLRLSSFAFVCFCLI
jgi:hypothetical protein